jgi:adenylate cyclase
MLSSPPLHIPRLPAAAQPAQAVRPIVDWLLGDGWSIPSASELTRQLGQRLNAAGVPVFRMRVTIRTLHPQFFGASYTWWRGRDDVDEYRAPYAVLEQETFLKSPYAQIFQGAGAIRRRLEDPEADLDFPILIDLKESGATDYVAMPLVFSDGRISAITLATDRPGGFASSELSVVDAALPVIAHAFELHALKQTARNVINAYLGSHSGERVLDGLVRRGDGEEIHAVLWFCDLRSSTALAERLPRPAFLQALNDFFEATAGAVIDHGGEVLRYIGDAALAIFPIMSASDCPENCPEHARVAARAVAAAEDAMQRMTTVNDARHARGLPKLTYGIGLHLGDVVYGNIGTPERLELTVVGPAANTAARLESLCKALHKPLLLSAELASLIRGRVVSLGTHVLRGVPEPREIFTLAGL